MLRTPYKHNVSAKFGHLLTGNGNRYHALRHHHGAQPLHRPVHAAGGQRALRRLRRFRHRHYPGHQAAVADVCGDGAGVDRGHLGSVAQPVAAESLRVLTVRGER